MADKITVIKNFNDIKNVFVGDKTIEGNWTFNEDVESTGFKITTKTDADVVLAGGGTTPLSGLATPILFKANTTLSSAQILALNTTPIEVVSAQGAGTVIVVQSIVYKYNFNTTDYSTQTSLQATYTGETPVMQSVANILNAGVDLIKGWGAGTIIEMKDNTGISIETPTADPTLGDGTVDVYITYEILTL